MTYTTAKALHKPSGYSLRTSCSFDKSKNKPSYYIGRDCMKRFCDDLKKHVTRITNYEMKPMDPLTEEEGSYKNQELCHICEKEFCTDNNKEMRNVRDHCHYTGKCRGAAHSKCNLNYKIVKEIPILFHNRSVYDYHFIIKYLAREFKGNSECLVENTEKYTSFTVPFKKVINDKEIKYKIRISDSCRFMQDSLSNLVGNLSELKIKEEIDNGVLIKRFYYTYQLSENDINKSKLLLRKGVYPYEYMDSWKRFNETELPSKDKFYNTLNLEDISDDDYAHAINVWNTFNINNLGEYHDLYVQLDTALLDIFENFRDKHIETDKLDPAYFLTTTGLSWEACLKKTGVKLELLTDGKRFLTFEEGIRSGICNKVHSYAEANNKYKKNYDKDKESSFLIYVDANHLYCWTMTKKLPVDGLKWVEDLSMFTEDFIKNYDEESDVSYLLVVDIEYPKTLRMLHSDLPFLPDRMKVNKVNKLVCNVTDKKNYSVHMAVLKQALNHGLKLIRVHSVDKRHG